jgi:DNA-binding transcriptional MerR regulator
VVLKMPTAKRKQALARAEVVIPEKIYFRIGEVGTLAKLPTYVLRFWESEFPQLRPTKSSTGQRMYRRRDVEFVMRIRKLLYEDGFTIAGARERLREEARRGRTSQVSSVQAATEEEPAADAPRAKRNAPSAAKSSGDAQAGLPFPGGAGAWPREELRSLRKQLSDVLTMLS